MGSLLPNLRYSPRMLRKNPGFTVVAVGTLALGIGANTAIFSVVNGVLLKPLAYREPGRLVVIHENVPKFAKVTPLVPVNAMHFNEWRKDSRSIEKMAMIGEISPNLTGSGEPRRLNGARVSWSLFPMLGVQAELGRTFTEDEDRPGHDHVVVLDNDLWKVQFAGDPNIIGRKIVLYGSSYDVIGVLPAGFRFPKISQLYAMSIAGDRPQIWKPMAIRDDELEAMGDFNYACIARLKPGVSLATAQSELNVIQTHISKTVAENEELRAVLVPLQDQITGRSRLGLVILLAAVGAVLLIACVNVANLLLVRATGRMRELAIRSAIGASSGQLMRQVLGESLLLAGLGGALGLLLAFAGLRALLAKAPIDLPRFDEIRLDNNVLLFTLAAAVLSGIVFGLLPAWRFARADPQDALKLGSRGATEARSGGRLRSGLVAAEVALSAMCLIGSGLLLHSFVKLLNVDRGFETQNIVTVDLSLSGSRYPDLTKRAAFLRSALDRVRSLPGVISAGVSNFLPLGGEGGNNLVSVEGTTVPFAERPLADIRSVNPDYFRTIGIPLRRGRIFEEADRDREVALVSAITAERLWPGENPLGKRFHIGGDQNPLMQVVGVVGDVRGVSLNRAPSMTVYMPYWRRFYGQASLAIRTATDPQSAATAVRAVIRGIDPELPAPQFRTMEQILAESVGPRRFQLDLVLLFGATALLLACLGIYGVVSYSVAQRTNEMGIRLALGARPTDILGLVLARAMAPVAAGLAIGILASLALGHLLEGPLFGVHARDPWTMSGVVVTLAAVAAIASYIPARRAIRVDPLTALRYE